MWKKLWQRGKQKSPTKTWKRTQNKASSSPLVFLGQAKVKRFTHSVHCPITHPAVLSKLEFQLMLIFKFNLFFSQDFLCMVYCTTQCTRQCLCVYCIRVLHICIVCVCCSEKNKNSTVTTIYKNDVIKIFLIQ